MRITLTAINSKYIHTALSILYLKRMTELSGRYEVDLVDVTINNSSYDILTEIYDCQPDVIAISVYIWNSTLVHELLADINAVLPYAKIVLGGPEVSYNASDWLTKFPFIDFIVTGSGEKSWRLLLDNGFVYKNQIISEPNISINALPFPYCEKLTADSVVNRNRIVYYESSRGCPYKCSFCLSSREEARLEYRSLDLVKKELNFFVKSRLPLVKFVDRTFNSSRKHAHAIWKHIIDISGETCFHFEINPYLLNEDDLNLLKHARKGMIQFEIGIQSTNRETLIEINRLNNKQNIEPIPPKLKSVIDQLEGIIPIHVDLVFGLPFEGYEQAQKSFNDVYRLQANHFQAGMLKVLPGTVMQENSGHYEMVHQRTPPYRILKNRWISLDQLSRLRNLERLVNSLYNSHQFEKTLDYLIGLYETPFDFFDSLLDFWASQELDFWMKNWYKIAQLLVQFFDEREEPECLLDCLRWDLCFSTAIKSYPGFLDDEKIRAENKVWTACKKMLKNKNSKQLPEYLLLSHKSLFFRPQSEQFRLANSVDEDECFIAATNDEGEVVAYRIKHVQIMTLLESNN